MNWIAFGAIGACVMLLLLAIVLKVKEYEHRNIIFGGREFEVYLSSEFSGRMCAVSIYEVVRPNWKIFRTNLPTYKSFWISDYATIKEGVYAMLESYLADEAEDKEICDKWKEV